MMGTLRLVFLCAIVVLPSFTAGAQDAAVCGPRQDVIDRLKRAYGEYRVATGLAADGRIVEVFSSDDGWTILLTEPSGRSCIAAVGEPGHSWQRISSPGRRDVIH